MTSSPPGYRYHECVCNVVGWVGGGVGIRRGRIDDSQFTEWVVGHHELRALENLLRRSKGVRNNLLGPTMVGKNAH